MKARFLLALLLGAGVAVAQAQEQQPGMPNSAPSTSPNGTTNNNGSPSKAKQEAPVGQTEMHTASSGVAQPQSTSMKGCLKQSSGNWTLISDDGSVTNISGDDSTLKPHDGQQVEIQGMKAADGSIQATTVNMIANSCPNDTASATTSQPPAASSTGTDQAAAGASTTQTTTTQQSESTTTANTPVTNQTPATSVGTGNANTTSASNMTGQSAAQTPDTNAAPANADQNAVQQNPSTTATTQSNNATSDTSTQNAATSSNTGDNAGQKLPQTASPLPLLGLLGLGSLAGGFFARKKK